MSIKRDLLGIQVNNWQEVERLRNVAAKAAMEDKPTKSAFFQGKATALFEVANLLSKYIDTIQDDE